MRIPTRDEHQSMDLGQAVAICLFELMRNPKEAARKPAAIRKAKVKDLHLMTERLLEILAHSGYFEQPSSASTTEKVRRLIRRMDLNSHDADVWLGMLRQIRLANEQVQLAGIQTSLAIILASQLKRRKSVLVGCKGPVDPFVQIDEASLHHEQDQRRFR